MSVVIGATPNRNGLFSRVTVKCLPLCPGLVPSS